MSIGMSESAATPGTVEMAPPAPWSVLVIVAIVPAVSLLLRWASGATLVGRDVGIVMSVASAGLIGVPAVAWAMTHRRRQPGAFAALGFVAGLLPLLLVLMSGLIGLTIRHGWAEMVAIVRIGAPLPWLGQIDWLRFIEHVVWCGVVGSTSAIVHWSAVVSRPLARGLAVAAIALALAAGIVAVLPHAPGTYRGELRLR